MPVSDADVTLSGASEATINVGGKLDIDNIAEMLVAEAPNSRAIQDMAVRCGVTDVRYPFRNKDCVLCGRCVRVCREVWQSKSLGFVGRGN